jgi:cell wall-associated NlpC family hydrolase
MYALLGLAASACASTHSVPRPFPLPPGAPDRTASGAPISSVAIVDTALSLRGARYRDGGTGPVEFDCSGFTQYVFAKFGLPLAREVRDQYREGRPIRPEEIAAGDLLFFTTTAPGASHVGIAIDNDRFIHAPSSTGVVRVERRSAPYWSRRFVGARRLR